uniref:UBZ4-type domain-containing protein n=1 Tax=Schistosoma mansoni TaxID=6183 RepID=A0A5K4F9Z9_SCHMA
MQESNDLKFLTNPNYFHCLGDLNKLDNYYQMNKNSVFNVNNHNKVNEDLPVPIFPSKYINSDEFFRETLKLGQSSSELTPAESIQTYLMNAALWNALNLDQFKQQCYNLNEHTLNEKNLSQQINIDTVKDFTNYNFEKRRKLNEHYPSSSHNSYYLNSNCDNKTEYQIEKRRRQTVHDQYENQSLNNINNYTAKYMINSQVNNSTNSDTVEKYQSSPIQKMTDGEIINQFICPICRSEIKPDDLESHFKIELEKMQNFTINLPIEQTSPDKLESPKYSQPKIDKINSDSRFEIFKKVERNRRERREKYFKNPYLLNPHPVQNEMSE